MHKEFLPFITVRNNALKLAHKIHMDGFVPDVIYVSLRGGAGLGNVISEYFKIIKTSRPVLYAAVVARSYSDVHEHDQVRVDGWTYSPEYLRPGDKVLLVDDIFDSGRTINHLAQVILEKGVPREDLKIAVHDFKLATYRDEKHKVFPDYYCRKYEVSKKEDELWIHYMSHELIGLSKEELDEYYYKEDPELEKILSILHKS